jgi:hypothetical protein
LVSAWLDRRIAWHAIDAAVDAGFILQAGDGDSLDIHSPPGLSQEVRTPIERALIQYRAEVLKFLAFLASEERRGRHWRPGARGTPQ